MKVAAQWTRLNAIALAGFATAVSWFVLGGGVLAWVLALPLMFFGLQLLGLPIVMFCELAERMGVLPGNWRPLADEVVIVVCLVALSFLVLPAPFATAAMLFFGGMYVFRLLAGSAWRPGEAEEVSG